MDINIRQYASNQGVSVHVNGKKNVTINEINENGVTPLLTPRRKGALHWITNGLKNKKSRRYVALASVLVLTGTISLSFLNRAPLEDRLYDKYYKRFDKGSLVMFNNSAFNEATKRYEQGDVKAAWYIIENLPDNYSIQKELVLYKALSSMEMGHYKAAIHYFDILAEQPDNKSFIIWVKWYQGLCYLKIKDTKAAQNALSFIPPLFPEENKKAQKIIKRLKKHSETK